MKVQLKIPGSTANLGPGFDTLSLAIDIYLYVTCEKASETKIINHSRMFITDDPDQNLIYQVISQVSQNFNRDIPTLLIEIDNEIPLERGLGSSSAAIIAGILIADFYGELKMSKESILETAGLFESHLDNVAASLYGSLNVILGKQSVRMTPVDSIKLSVFIPQNYYTNTKTSRHKLPSTLELDAVVKTLQNSAGVILYLTSDLASTSFRDYLHQPHRMIPGTDVLFDHNCFISGSGPCIMHVYKCESENQKDFIYSALNKTGIEWISRSLSIDRFGAQINFS